MHLETSQQLLPTWKKRPAAAPMLSPPPRTEELITPPPHDFVRQTSVWAVAKLSPPPRLFGYSKAKPPPPRSPFPPARPLQPRLRDPQGSLAGERGRRRAQEAQPRGAAAWETLPGVGAWPRGCPWGSRIFSTEPGLHGAHKEGGSPAQGLILPTITKGGRGGGLLFIYHRKKPGREPRRLVRPG